MSATRDEIQNIVTRWFEEVWNQRREATIDELMDVNSVFVADGDSISGPGDFRAKMFIPFHTAFPDLNVSVDQLVIEGETAVVRWSARGTHRGAGLGVPPTGRKAEVSGISWMKIRNGRLSEGWQYSTLAQVIHGLIQSAD